MRLQRQSDRQIIYLDSALELGAGGEAQVFALNADPSLVAKVYRKPKADRDRKLRAMLNNPPDDLRVSQSHLSFAWPLDLLLTLETKPQVAGFLMPRVEGMRPIIDFYNPKTRRLQCPLFDYFYLHRAARNLAGAVSGLHARGYAIGDVNESNILLTDTALVTLVDLDSIQVRDPETGMVYRCPVGKPEFTPPELQGQPFAEIDRTPEHDVFGLAVLIFQLLMEGTHPFGGVYKLPGDPPPMEKRIAEGYFPYGRRKVPFGPMTVAPPFEILHPTLQQLFVRCFEDGHQNPKSRPDALTWKQALKEAEEALVTCEKNDQHRYGNHLKRCPWCDRSAALGGRDPFPSRLTVQKGLHLKPAPTQKILVQSAPWEKLTHKAYTPLALPPALTGTGALPSPIPRPKRSRLPLLELNLPPVNPLLAGVAILLIATAGIIYGNGLTPTVQFSPPTLSPRPSLKTIARTPITVLRASPRDAVQAIALSPTLLVSHSNSIDIWRLPDFKALSPLANATSTSAIGLSGDGTILASANRNDDTVTLWQLPTLQPLRTLTTHKVVVTLALSPKRQLLVTGSRDNTMRLWNINNNTRIRTFEDWNAGWVNAVALSPNDQLLAAGTETGSIHIIDLNTYQDRAIATPTTVPVKTLAWTPDSKMLATNQSSQINLWDLATGKLKTTFNGHDAAVQAIAISPDGKLLASGGLDQKVKIWNLNTHELLDTLDLTTEIVSLSFSPDGKLLANGNADGSIEIRELLKTSVSAESKPSTPPEKSP